MFDLSLPLEGKETCCTCGCIPLLLELLTDQDSDTLAQAIASLMRYHFPTLTSLPTSPHLLPSHHFPALTLTSLPHPHPHITSPPSPSHHFPALTLTSLPHPHPHITSPPSPSHHFQHCSHHQGKAHHGGTRGHPPACFTASAHIIRSETEHNKSTCSSIVMLRVITSSFSGCVWMDFSR